MSGHERTRERGSSLVELLVVVAVLLPILASITKMNQVVTRTVNADDHAAEVTENLRKTAQRVGGLLRPGKLSTFQVQANADDVSAGLASSRGEWISPTDLSPRESIRFLAAEGLLSMNARLNTPPRQLTFALDNGELRNGADDDDDGLVDEGTLTLLYGTIRVPLARNLERCDFTFDGRLVRMTLRAAQRDSQGRMFRTTIEQAFYVRNN